MCTEEVWGRGNTVNRVMEVEAVWQLKLTRLWKHDVCMATSQQKICCQSHTFSLCCVLQTNPHLPSVVTLKKIKMQFHFFKVCTRDSQIAHYLNSVRSRLQGSCNSVTSFSYLFLTMSLHTADSSERSLRLSFVTITPSVFCASCSMNLQKGGKKKNPCKRMLTREDFGYTSYCLPCLGVQALLPAVASCWKLTAMQWGFNNQSTNILPCIKLLTRI